MTVQPGLSQSSAASAFAHAVQLTTDLNHGRLDVYQALSACTNNSGNNFCQTQLDDAATSSIEGVTSANAPFSGTFSPLNPQAAFIGQTAAGVWTLHVADSTFIDSGNVRAFSITVNGLTCGPPSGT